MSELNNINSEGEIIIPEMNHHQSHSLTNSERTISNCDISDSEDEPSSIEVSIPQPLTRRWVTPTWTISTAETAFSSDATGFVAFQNKKQRYWKTNFVIVFLPLIFWGIPLHILLFGKRGINSTKQWLKSIFLEDHPLMIIFLTVPFFIFGLAINAFFLYLAGTFLYRLIGLGEIRQNVYEDTINVLRTVPIVIPVNVVWFKGYYVRKLILSFDRITYPMVEGIMETKITKKTEASWNSVPGYRVWIVILYILLAIYEVIQGIILVEGNKVLISSGEYENDSGIIFNNWIDFLLNLMYNLMLPIYASFCMAVEFEFLILSKYIKYLVHFGVHPDFKYLDEVKRCYKQIARHVVLINDICSIYFSWVILVLYLALYSELRGILFKIILDVINSTLKTNTSGEVRLFVGNVFGIILEILIIGFTIWFGICANDKARYLHVRLNDFATQPGVFMSPELYKSFRLLKYYIHSRMEVDKPALLTISILGRLPLVGSWLQRWMTNYDVRH